MSHPALVRRALPCALALSLGAGLLIGPASPAAAAIVPNPIGGSVADPGLTLTPSVSYESGVFGESAAEIVTHHGSRIFTVNAVDGTVDVLDASADALTEARTLSLVGAPVVGGGSVPAGAAANSLTIRADGLGVVAVQNPVKTDAGWLVSFDADTGSLLSAVTVGALPDMVTLTEDGATALVANEGEPSDDFTVDPEGSVSVVALPATVSAFDAGTEVRTADFHDFEVDGRKRARFDERTRVFGSAPHGDDLAVSRNLEPEYITVSGGKAYVALQEANAIGVLDIATAEFERVWSLGLKDHSLEQNSLTTSNQANRATNPRQDALLRERHTYEHLSGLYMPDGIDSYTVGGETYLVTANEGDAREWGGYVESVRVADLPPKDDGAPHGYGPVCADVFTTEQLGAPYLGRLNVSIESPFDTERGCYTGLHAFGARSFSIYEADGTQVYDSGDDFETITAELFPEGFNTTNDENTLGNRNDDKGPEPENVTIGQLEGRIYAFVGLERVGGIMTYDITDPTAPSYVSYVNNRDFTASPSLPAPTPEDADAVRTNPAAGDLGPEGVHFIPADESVTGRPMLAVGNETSGTTTLYDIAVADSDGEPGTPDPGTPEPGAPNPGTPNPGTPGSGAPGSSPGAGTPVAAKPSTAPAAAAASALTAALENRITSDDRSLSAGQTIRILVGEQFAGDWVQVWLHSTPVLLGGGWLQVDAAGYVTVELPDALPAGAHRLAVLDAEGNVIGWQSVTVADTGTASLADTGAQVAPGLVFGALMLVAGAVLVITRRRAAQA